MFKRALVFLTLLLPLLALGQEVKVEKYKLPNGMTVILHEDKSLPIVSVNLWFHVGSKDEVKGRTGFAHLFEHLMFMGTERAPGSQFDLMMEAGGGSNNATTSADRTEYYSNGPAGLLPTLLWLEADRMEDLGRMMDQKKLDLQREVVRNERRENYEQAPYGMVGIRLYEMLYPAGHPYHHLTIGSHQDLEAATVQDVKDFFAKYYVPNNASLVVAGNFDPVSTKPMIASLFGTLPRKDDPYHGIADNPKLPGIVRATMVDKVPLPKTFMAWHSPGYYKPGDGEMDLTGAILSDGVSSRLYRRLVDEKNMATDVSAYQASQMLGSVFMIEATPTEGTTLDALEAEIDAVVREFTEKGPTAEELSRQIAKIEYGSMTSLQSLQGRASQLNEYEFYYGDPSSFKRDVDRYRRTPQQVRDVARGVLDPNARVILRVVPQEEQAQATNPRNVKPTISEEAAFNPQSPVEFKLANGIPVYYWHKPSLPLMQMATVFRGGSIGDPSGKAGRAAMMASMLDQGAGNLDAFQFEQALDTLGANFGASAGRLGTTVTLSSLAGNFEKALALYSDAMQRPKLARDDWERIQKSVVASLEQSLEDPGTMASIVANREFFGASSPYGQPGGGMPQTVQAITAADLRAAYESIVNPQNAAVFIAGSLDQAQVRSLLDRSLGNWKASGQAFSYPKVAVPARDAMRVLIVDKPEAVQTVVRFVFPSENSAHASRIPLETVSTVFGGTFTSRINNLLREQKGYTYGAGSGVSQDPLVGTVVASSGVRADVTGPALKDFLAEIARLGTGDLNEEELTKARKAIRTDTIQSLASLGSLIGNAVQLYLDGRPFSSIAGDLEAVSKLDVASANTVAKTAMPLNRGLLVLVGDKDLILKQMEGLNLPKPEIVTVR